jgi:hypothetical protein
MATGRLSCEDPKCSGENLSLRERLAEAEAREERAVARVRELEAFFPEVRKTLADNGVAIEELRAELKEDAKGRDVAIELLRKCMGLTQGHTSLFDLGVQAGSGGSKAATSRANFLRDEILKYLDGTADTAVASQWFAGTANEKT